MYLLDLIFIIVISQLLILKLHVRHHATREDHKSSVISKPKILELLFILECSRKYRKWYSGCWRIKKKRRKAYPSFIWTAWNMLKKLYKVICRTFHTQNYAFWWHKVFACSYQKLLIEETPLGLIWKDKYNLFVHTFAFLSISASICGIQQPMSAKWNRASSDLKSIKSKYEN